MAVLLASAYASADLPSARTALQILTFDDDGISSHPNHVSLPAGAAHMLSASAGASPPDPLPRLFALVTVPLYQKYLGLLSPLSKKLSFAISSPPAREAVAVSSWAEYARAHRAMRQHWSQLVWFRWLYVSFSRYMWVNEWVELVPPSAAQTARPAEP